MDSDGCAYVVELHVEVAGGELGVREVNAKRDVRVDFAIHIHCEARSEVQACVLRRLSKLEVETDARGGVQIEGQLMDLGDVVVERSECTRD